MAREGKVIVKILKDVCSPIPYMGHSHERSLVHLLNPCSDVNRKEAQCGTVTFDYYQEGDNLVFKTKHNPNIVGYRTDVSITVVYWDTRINAYVHSQGDGNGGEFNKPNFFKQEGEYFIGKVNMEWFRKQNGFQYEPIAIHYNYVDLDNHEEEILDCYSEQKKPSEFVPKNRLVKCSPILTVTRQDLAAGFNYHLVLSINDTYTSFKVGENVKYYIKYSIDDVEQPEELVYTHTTGGLVPNKEKDIFVPGHIKKVYFKFRIEYPKGYNVGYSNPNQTECYAERTDITPNGKPKPNPIINCNPNITFDKVRSGRTFTYNLILQPNATVPANTVTKHYLSYAIDGVWNPEELVHTNTIGGTLDVIRKSIVFNVYGFSTNVEIKYRVEYPSNVKTNSGNGECSVTASDSILYSAEEDCSCESPRLEINTTSKKATFTTNISITSAELQINQPILYKSDDGVTWEKETETYNELSSYVFEFNLSEPIKKFYKAEVSIVENGRPVRVCSATYEFQNKPFVKCSPFAVITNKQHQPTGWSFDVVLQPRATVPANTTTKYFFDYTVNGAWQGEELVQTNTTGGELPDFTKSIFTNQESGIVNIKFKIELPPEVDTGGDRTCYFEIPVELKDNKPTIHCNPIITYEKELSGNYVLYKLKLNPNDTSTNFIAGKNVYYFVKSYFDGVNQGESLVYKHNTGGILPIRDNYVYVHNKTVKKVKIEFRIEYPSDYYEVDKRVCDYTIEDDDVFGQNLENSFDCSRATMSGTPFNCDQTYDTGLSSFADIIKNNYEVTPKVYYSPDGGTNWEVYEEGSQSLSGGEDTDYVYRGCIQKKFGILRYKFGVELKNKKTGVISDKKCYVEFMLEDTVQEQSHCYSITVSEREANEEVKYKGDIYINMFRGYDVLPAYKIKTYYRYYDETDYKELSETTIDMTTYVDNTVAYTAFVQNPRDKYYLKAELIRPDVGYAICETEENLIRKE